MRITKTLVMAMALILALCPKVPAATIQRAHITKTATDPGQAPLITHPDGTQERAHPCMYLEDGDRVRTMGYEGCSGVELELGDGNIIRIGANADFRLCGVEAGGKGYIKVGGYAEQSLRRLWFNLIHPGAWKNVVTPIAVTAIKGTEFLMTDSFDNLEEISVVEGEVRASMISWGVLPNEYFFDPGNKCLDTLNFDYISSLEQDPVDLLGRDTPVTINAGFYVCSESGEAFSSPIAGLAPTHDDYQHWIPEPATVILLGLGGLASLFRRRVA